MFKAQKRPVDRVFIHCTASESPVNGQELKALVYNWHVNERGWANIGYHYLIDKQGLVIPCRPLEEVPASQAGHNTGTISICVHGLSDFTQQSLDSLKSLCEEINTAYEGKISFHGHCEVSNKSCPVFDYKKLLGLDFYGFM